MAVQMEIVYQGQLRCEATHGPSGSVIRTDAPTDNMGRGEAFSPTDLVGVALGTCILTTMGIVAQRDGIALEGTTIRVIKEMTTQGPRRIAKLSVEFTIPHKLDREQQHKLELAGRTCPVHRALDGNVEMPITFHWAQ